MSIKRDVVTDQEEMLIDNRVMITRTFSSHHLQLTTLIMPQNISLHSKFTLPSESSSTHSSRSDDIPREKL
jgi:hypothetical protein